jgi:RNA polymerase sigma factor (sigma-70 family)
VPVRRKKIAEQELVALVRLRDPRGAAALYDQYSAALYGVISRIVPEKDVSEDILQEAYMRIWDHFGSYDPAKGRLFTWMVNIARRAAFSKLSSKDYRSQRRNGAFPVTEILFIAPDAIYTRAEQSFMRELNALLPVPELLVINMIYYRGYTHAEAAEALNLPLGTVKTRLARAIKRLRVVYGAGTLVQAS